MIFVTVGTQLHFDRLVATVDDWTISNPTSTVFAQVGQTNQVFQNLEYTKRMTPAEMAEMFSRCDCVVSHAGMGSVLMALRFQKPIIVMPRRAELAEHRNNHQIATAKWLQARSGVNVAWTEAELKTCLDGRAELAAGDEISEYAEPKLLKKLRDFIGKV